MGLEKRVNGSRFVKGLFQPCFSDLLQLLASYSVEVVHLTQIQSFFDGQRILLSKSCEPKFAIIEKLDDHLEQADVNVRGRVTRSECLQAE